MNNCCKAGPYAPIILSIHFGSTSSAENTEMMWTLEEAGRNVWDVKIQCTVTLSIRLSRPCILDRCDTKPINHIIQALSFHVAFINLPYDLEKDVLFLYSFDEFNPYTVKLCTGTRKGWAQYRFIYFIDNVCNVCQNEVFCDEHLAPSWL